MVNASLVGSRVVGVALLASVLGGQLGAASGSGSPVQSVEPIVSVIRQGGFCRRMECRSTLRIDDTTISGDGYTPRRLKTGERLALLGAIRKLALPYLRAHPFAGMCPTAYDGSESIYRFRGFARPLASCTYDLQGVDAVRLAEQLFKTLRPTHR